MGAAKKSSRASDLESCLHVQPTKPKTARAWGVNLPIEVPKTPLRHQSGPANKMVSGIVPRDAGSAARTSSFPKAPRLPRIAQGGQALPISRPSALSLVVDAFDPRMLLGSVGFLVVVVLASYFYYR